MNAFIDRVADDADLLTDGRKTNVKQVADVAGASVCRSPFDNSSRVCCRHSDPQGCLTECRRGSIREPDLRVVAAPQQNNGITFETQSELDLRYLLRPSREQLFDRNSTVDNRQRPTAGRVEFFISVDLHCFAEGLKQILHLDRSV